MLMNTENVPRAIIFMGIQEERILLSPGSGTGRIKNGSV